MEEMYFGSGVQVKAAKCINGKSKIRENVILISGFWIKIRFKLSFVSLSFLDFKEHPIKIIPFRDDKTYGLMILLLGIFTQLLWRCGLKYKSIHIMLGSTDLLIVICGRDIIKISKLMVLGYPIIKQDFYYEYLLFSIYRHKLHNRGKNIWMLSSLT